MARESLEKARLAGVGVAHERCRGQVATPPPALALVGAMLGDVLEPLFERRDLAADDAAVGFELGFAGSPEPDAAADTGEVGPHAREARPQVLELRPLDLEPRFVTARARRADVENDFGAVPDAPAETP